MAETRPGLAKARRTGGDGSPEVFCADEQVSVEVDLERWQALALDVLEAEGVRGAAELTVVFVDEGTMQQLNAQYMGNNYATDVLAFPLDAVEVTRTPGPGALTKGPDKNEFDIADLPLLLGDVVICPTVAVKQAPLHAGTEFCMYSATITTRLMRLVRCKLLNVNILNLFIGMQRHLPTFVMCQR